MVIAAIDCLLFWMRAHGSWQNFCYRYYIIGPLRLSLVSSSKFSLRRGIVLLHVYMTTDFYTKDFLENIQDQFSKWQLL